MKRTKNLHKLYLDALRGVVVVFGLEEEDETVEVVGFFAEDEAVALAVDFAAGEVIALLPKELLLTRDEAPEVVVVLEATDVVGPLGLLLGLCLGLFEVVLLLLSCEVASLVGTSFFVLDSVG